MPLVRPRAHLWLVGVALLTGLYIFSQLATGSTPMLLMSPLLEALHAPARWWQGATLWFADRDRLQSDYSDFRRKVEQQAALIQEANSLREENRQLRSILDIAGMPGYRWHAAKVRGRSPESMSQRLVLEVDSVSRDDVIVSSEGLVGVIDSTSEDHATVRTIFDASLAVPVTLPDTPLAALARGQGSSIAIDFIPLQLAPHPGQVLYTSGAGGLFPPGIAVARITEVKPIEGRLFVEASAEPVAHWQRDNWLAVASQLHATP
ncbi:rod shape-determining protein MreC [Mariprofundus erugo]|uniref:Cell shape-determining protein MreC n=1 Tax=Mariprofundus erugo TaxID=2528639 RepID=A0A5R9GMR6_9PROT|nr:rod shape-determining protein MreC [Mariprofundus erugo]TLS66968.1 rod shape-determining protein MreC [Mariprofundus erugo]TLS77332.1 rod shape-determining protein MreC [Mariprofundus erugo]